MLNVVCVDVRLVEFFINPLNFLYRLSQRLRQYSYQRRVVQILLFFKQFLPELEDFEFLFLLAEKGVEVFSVRRLLLKNIFL